MSHTHTHTLKYNRTKVTFIISYLLALGPGLFPDLQVGLIADHSFLSIQRRHLVLIKQKPQVLQIEGPEEKNSLKMAKMGMISSVDKIQKRTLKYSLFYITYFGRTGDKNKHVYVYFTRIK